ncbi:hypothetical protein MPER_10202 [Moniliophthora perniciosa FA553]|nr:hypothetical protein MPER_10202 [Moniliophthora perniciosa FA553]
MERQVQGLVKWLKSGMRLSLLWSGMTALCGLASELQGKGLAGKPLKHRYYYRSIRRTAFSGLPSLPGGRTANLENGTIIKDIDQVIVGTGYRPYPSFIHVRTGVQMVPLMNGTISPHRIPSLHRHILYAHDTSLVLIGSFMAYTPFTMKDIASSLPALIWTDEIAWLEQVNMIIGHCLSRFCNTLHRERGACWPKLVRNRKEPMLSGMEREVVVDESRSVQAGGTEHLSPCSGHVEVNIKA